MDFRIFLLVLVAFLATCLTQHGASGDEAGDTDTALPRTKRQIIAEWELLKTVASYAVKAYPFIKNYVEWSIKQADYKYLQEKKLVWHCRNKTIQHFPNETQKIIAEETEAMKNGHVDRLWILRRSIIDNSIHDYTLKYTAKWIGLHRLAEFIDSKLDDIKSDHKKQLEAIKMIRDYAKTGIKALDELFERDDELKFFTGLIPKDIDIPANVTECAAKYMFCVDNSIIKDCVRDIVEDYKIVYENKDNLDARVDQAYSDAKSQIEEGNHGAVSRILNELLEKVKKNHVFAYAANFVSFFEASDQMYMLPLIAKRLTPEECSPNGLSSKKVELKKCFESKKQ